MKITTRTVLLAALVAMLGACSPAEALRHGETTASQPSAPAPASPPAAPARPCGMSPDDWCPSPPGDACGVHKDTASCKADARCKGMGYRGESVVACHVDARGFADNCPTVGCISH